MEGVGYTIMQGTNVEAFNVKVISVLRKSWNGSDAILISMTGLDLEHSGTIAGMSGSPIYIDGRLAGALAFGWQFAKDPIAGVTPIEQMYELYDDNNLQKTFESSNLKTQNALKTPLLFSGFNSYSFSKYQDNYEKMGFYPIQGGGSIYDTNMNTNFVFGDAAAIVLVDGDLSVAGIGTVSHTDNEKFLLFGHSMFAKGRLKAPVSKAYINGVVASSLISFKLGSAYSNYLGYTVYDGIFGVSGVYGEVPKDTMIPVEITVEDQTFLTNKFNVRILNEPTYFSMLLSQTLMNAIGSSSGNDEEGVFSMSYEIYTDYFDEPYTITNRVLSYSSQDAYKDLISSIVSPIDFFTYNNIKRIGIKSIKINLKRDNLEYGFLESISLVEPIARAGETVHLRIALREYNNEISYITIPVKLPVSLNTGIYTLFAGNEYLFEAAQRLYMPNKYKIRSLDDIMKYYNKSYSYNDLKVWLYSSSRGVSINGDNYPNLPPSYYGILAKENTSDKSSYISAIDGSLSLPYSILGLLNIKLLIQGVENYEN